MKVELTKREIEIISSSLSYTKANIDYWNYSELWDNDAEPGTLITYTEMDNVISEIQKYRKL